MYVASVFIWILHMFHTYDASVLSECYVCLQWFSVFFKCFCKCLRHMFHLFSNICCNLLHLDVSKLDRVLLLPPRLSAISPRCQVREGGGDPTGASGPHMLAGKHNRRDIGRQAWYSRGGQRHERLDVRAPATPVAYYHVPGFRSEWADGPLCFRAT
jgi:hypothetical protein